MDAKEGDHPKRVYHTPTRSAAQVLEAMVASGRREVAHNHSDREERTLQPKPSSSSTSSSSSNERRSLRRSGKTRIGLGVGPSEGTDVFGNIAWNTGLGAGQPPPPFPIQSLTSPPLPPLPPLPPFPAGPVQGPRVPYDDLLRERTEETRPVSPPNSLLEPPPDRKTAAQELANVGVYPETASSSKKPRRPSESFRRRTLEEVIRQHPEHLYSQYPNATEREGPREEDPSPTDSHPHHSQPTHHSHPRTRTTSHSHARSRATSDAARLLVTTERLNAALTRASNAEKQIAELLSLFKTTYEAKVSLETELAHVTSELNGYKVMLDVAQNEIYRAQEIVDRLERQRVEAEDEAIRTRQNHRKLLETRAVEQAIDEGRRLGYEEGLKQGRNLNDMYDYMDSRAESRRGGRGRSRDEVPVVSRAMSRSRAESLSNSETSSSRRSQRSSESDRSAEVPRSQAPPSRSTSVAAHPTHPHGTPPDVGRYSDTLPIQTLSTPPPIRVPSTQPQPPPPMPPHQPPMTPHPSGRTRSNSRPDIIDLEDPNAPPIHPVPVHNRSPSVMHRPITLPPDNFIPTMGANSMISLPPPHELNRPVAPETTATRPAPQPQAPPPPPSSNTNRPRAGSRATESSGARDHAHAYPAQEDKSRAPSRASAPRTDPYSRRQTPGIPTSSRAISVASTRLSELNLLESPSTRDAQRARAGYDSRSRSRNEVENPNAGRVSGTQPATERGAHEWRMESREYARPTSPESLASRRDGAGSSRGAGPSSVRNPIDRPMSTEPTRVRSPGTYPNRPPRRPREIILPTPLGNTLLRANMAPSAGASGHFENPLRPPESSRNIQTNLSPPSPPHNSRSTSNMTVPGIEVHTPSTQGTTHSEQTAIDPGLLTPEGANLPLPQGQPGNPNPSGTSTQPSAGGDFFMNRIPDDPRISMFLPEDNLPAGFVPLSPIPGMAGIRPYPPEFAPSLPRGHPVGGAANFVYPSAPLVRVS